MDKKHRKVLLISIIPSVISLIVGMFFIMNNDDNDTLAMIASIIMGTVLVCSCIFWIVYYKKYTSNGISSKDMKALHERLAQASKKINELYEKTEFFNKVGFAKFAEDGLEFEVIGKFAVIKDFNGKTGDHFAFEITATEMTSKPEDYADVCDYENVGFSISVGYFDGSPLSDENESGVVITDFSNIVGKTVELNGKGGYDFTITTVECDEIEKGQIAFIKHYNNELTIAFKFSIPWGLYDVVTGTVALKRDDKE